jgi:phosphatidylserine/phosphatidylglycerophosphate/cardiolipin synthase-like enzyme
MHRRAPLALAVLMAGVIAFPSKAHASSSTTWQVYFSPNGGAQQAVVRALNEARASVYVQAYSFTNTAIAKALVDAAHRGIAINVILDRSNRTARYSAATFLENSGIHPAIDAAHEIAHNKIIVIDETLVITGSFNFTNGAETRNAENLLLLRDPALAQRYLENWRAHRAHSH